MEEDFCEPLDEEGLKKAAVIPKVKGRKVVLFYNYIGLPVEGGDMLFVWDLEDNLYVHQAQGSDFHHVCFKRAMPVKMAGEVAVGHHGILKEVWAASGHYKPTDAHLREFYRFLQRKLPRMTPSMVKWVNEYTELKPREFAKYLFAKEETSY